MSDARRGFTLIELLIVLALIGLIGVLAAVAVGSARSKQRDATRLSAVRLTQSALEDYFNDTNAYPVGTGLPLGDSSGSACLGSEGFAASCTGSDTTFLRVVTGTISTGLDDLVTCGEPTRSAFCYTQTAEGTGYTIQFELENALPPVGLAAGINCATPTGFSAGTCK